MTARIGRGETSAEVEGRWQQQRRRRRERRCRLRPWPWRRSTDRGATQSRLQIRSLSRCHRRQPFAVANRSRRTLQRRLFTCANASREPCSRSQRLPQDSPRCFTLRARCSPFPPVSVSRLFKHRRPPLTSLAVMAILGLRCELQAVLLHDCAAYDECMQHATPSCHCRYPR